MEDKRIIYLIIIVIIVIILATGVGILLYQRMNAQPVPPPITGQPDEPDGNLPHLGNATSSQSGAESREQQQEKEKQFIKMKKTKTVIMFIMLVPREAVKAKKLPRRILAINLCTILIYQI